jgi:hypothetical protein
VNVPSIHRDDQPPTRRSSGFALHDGTVTDEPAGPSVLDRLLASGMTAGRIEQHLEAGRIRLDGEPVTVPHVNVPIGSRIAVA